MSTCRTAAFVLLGGFLRGGFGLGRVVGPALAVLLLANRGLAVSPAGEGLAPTILALRFAESKTAALAGIPIDRAVSLSSSAGGAAIGDDWEWVDTSPREPERESGGEISVARAVASSLVFPGLGQRHAGHPDRARLFYATEAAIWATFAFYRIQADQRRDRAEEYAVVNAGANPDGDSDYFEDIGYWISIDEWHEIVRRDARLRFPDDLAAQAAWFEENKRYDLANAWEWPDDDTRLRFRVLRSRSERSYRSARMAVGAAVLNRLLSMIDTLRLARRHNRELREARAEHAQFDLRVGPKKTVDGLVVGPILSARY
jgi:hypothetical protein